MNYSHSLTWTGWGYVAASVEVPPDKLDDFFADVDKIAADLRAKEPTADELARAKKPRIDRIERARLTNQYWLGELSDAQVDPASWTPSASSSPAPNASPPPTSSAPRQTWLRRRQGLQGDRPAEIDTGHS